MIASGKKWKVHGQTLAKQSFLSQTKDITQTFDTEARRRVYLAVNYVWV